MAFRKDNKFKSDFEKITISLASPESILERSHGEVLKPETINYRTYKPRKETVCFVKEFLVQLKIMSVTVVNTKG